MARARILLADDHEIFRDGLANLLAREPDFEVVGQAGDGFEALERARELKPDLILMDISMPICNGVEGTRLIHSALPSIRILILSISEDESDLFEALRAGASGFIQKDSSKAVFLRAIRQVLVGEAPLSPRQATSVLRAFQRSLDQIDQPHPTQDDSNITLREREVLELMVTGASNEQIAQELDVSVFTVKSHVRNILHKLEASNRREAAKVALQRGIITGKHLT